MTSEKTLKIDDMPEEKNVLHEKYLIISRQEASEIQDALPVEEELYDLADLYKMFSDSTRIKILCILLESEMCVYDLASILNMSHSAISHQLRILKQSKLVRNRRDGKVIFYSLADEHIRKIIDNGLEHIQE